MIYYSNINRPIKLFTMIWMNVRFVEKDKNPISYLNVFSQLRHICHSSCSTGSLAYNSWIENEA